MKPKLILMLFFVISAFAVQPQAASADEIFGPYNVAGFGLTEPQAEANAWDAMDYHVAEILATFYPNNPNAIGSAIVLSGSWDGNGKYTLVYLVFISDFPLGGP